MEAIFASAPGLVCLLAERLDRTDQAHRHRNSGLKPPGSAPAQFAEWVAGGSGQCNRRPMELNLISKRALGIACIAVGGGDTLLSMAGIVPRGPPVGILAICGLFLLYRSSGRSAVRTIILVSGALMVWALIGLAVILFVHPLSFVSPVLVGAYLAGSTAFIVWSVFLLKRMGPMEAVSHEETTVGLGQSLARGIRHWLQ